ncbi:MAG: endolytic transglycosylase MltG, partial [Bacteroidales bacterium]
MKLTKKRKIVYGVFAVLLIILALNSLYIVKIINTYTKNVKEKCVVYIRPGATFSDIVDSVSVHLKDKKSFVKTAEYNNLQTSFKPGRYLFVQGMKNWEIVRTIQNGWESPMKLTLSGNIRSKERMASILGRKLAADSASFINYFNDTTVCQKYALTPQTFISLFIPNTYEVYWTMTPAQFVERMKKEHDAFWTSERENKAKIVGLSKTEVSILAS